MSAMKRGTCCIATSPTSISRLNVLWRFTKSKALSIKEPSSLPMARETAWAGFSGARLCLALTKLTKPFKGHLNVKKEIT